MRQRRLLLEAQQAQLSRLVSEGGVLLAFSPQVDCLIPITMQDHLLAPVTGLCTFPVTVSCNE